MDKLNIAENRNHLNYSKWIYIKRILWTFGKFFFRNSPRIAFGYRNTILRLFGAKIGKHVHIYSSTVIWFPWNLEIGNWSAIGEETLIYNLGKVTIGEKATYAQTRHNIFVRYVDFSLISLQKDYNLFIVCYNITYRRSFRSCIKDHRKIGGLIYHGNRKKRIFI